MGDGSTRKSRKRMEEIMMKEDKVLLKGYFKPHNITNVSINVANVTFSYTNMPVIFSKTVFLIYNYDNIFS